MNPILFDINPDVSIIIPTYDRDSYLPRCIDSVIQQTFQNWELLIVDDGSHDNTFMVIDSYLEKFHNIRYLKHKNRKLPYSRNAGIQASFGKYITFLDSDDAYLPEHIEVRFLYMQNHPEIDFIEGGCLFEEEILVVDYYNTDQLIKAQECVCGPTFFGKRKVFFELQGFHNILYGEDTHLWERAEKQFVTQKVKTLETYLYTRAETSITKNFQKQRSL